MGISFTTQLMGAAGAMAATIVLAGGRDEASSAKAVDFVERFTGLDFNDDRLSSDMSDPNLSIRLRGDVMLVAEQLSSPAVDAFVRGMNAIAAVCRRPDDAALAVQTCAVLLGARGTGGRRGARRANR